MIISNEKPIRFSRSKKRDFIGYIEDNCSGGRNRFVNVGVWRRVIVQDSPRQFKESVTLKFLFPFAVLIAHLARRAFLTRLRSHVSKTRLSSGSVRIWLRASFIGLEAKGSDRIRLSYHANGCIVYPGVLELRDKGIR